MAQTDMKNAPPLYGWVIGLAAGVVATAVSLLLVGIGGIGSVAIGIVIALVVGIIFSIAESPAKPAMKAGQVAQVTSAARIPTSNTEKRVQGSEPVVAPAMPDATSESPTGTVAQDTAADEGTKPAMLQAPVGAPDDLKQISGVGPVLETKLNELGIYHFWQIARWTPEEVVWVDGFLNFKGRIARDEWIRQASVLAQTSPSKPPA